MLATLDGLARAGEPVGPAVPPQYPYPAGCVQGTLASSALYRICMPPGIFIWTHDLFIFAHGYVTPSSTLRIPDEQLRMPDGSSIPDMANWMGYAFATTSYSTNGLAVPEGIADLTDLVQVFRQAHPSLNHVYLVGASDGGLITALALEQHPDVFHGGLATCGPIGDWNAQINYVGDFRVVFDYFFPGLMPGSPVSIPQSLMDNWDTHFSTIILPAILSPANQFSVTELFKVTRAAYDTSSPTAYTASVSNTIRTVLWYNVFGAQDAIAKLGGQPFDNWTRVYTGSAGDAALNAGIARFEADPAAINRVQTLYRTSGQLRAPLVTLHTTLDEIVPYWHAPLYRDKVAARGRIPRYDEFPPAARYGHCNFTTAEFQSALSLLAARVENPPPVDVDLTEGRSLATDPMSTVIYTHTLANTGKLAGTFSVEVASSLWPAVLVSNGYLTTTMSLYLDSGMSTTLPISLSIPAGTKGQSARIVLTATSQISPNIFIAVADVAGVPYCVFLPVVLR
jgi:pimeloyl-ACP methyl ester carboxylesterase